MWCGVGPLVWTPWEGQEWDGEWTGGTLVWDTEVTESAEESCRRGPRGQELDGFGSPGPGARFEMPRPYELFTDN